jgi:magnesium-transporting ATPase (P-type)
MLGYQIEDLSDDELGLFAEQTRVFARMNPLQKERVVRTLRSRGHTVGFLGDGINDAGALRAADVGISVDTAVDVAKESADIILLEKSLMVLEQGVIQGRMVFGNIVKYIKMTVSSNFGNVFSVLVASAFIPFLPMTSLQLLVQNLLSLAAIAAVGQIGQGVCSATPEMGCTRPLQVHDLDRTNQLGFRHYYFLSLVVRLRSKFRCTSISFPVGLVR